MSTLTLQRALRVRWRRGAARPLDLVLAFGIVFLPLAPWLVELWPRASYVRFGFAALIWLLVALGRVPVHRRLLGRWPLLLAAFALFQAVPLARAPALDYGLLRAANWLMFVPLAFVVYDRRCRRTILAALGVSGLLLLSGVVLQLGDAMAGAWGGRPLDDGTLALRYTSFLRNPNDLALFLVCLVVPLVLVTSRWTVRARLLGIAATTACAAAVLLAASRGMVLAAPIAVLYVLVAGFRRAALDLAVAGALAFVLLPLALPERSAAPGSTVASIGSASSGADVSLGERRARWNRLLEQDTHPLVGGGYGGYAPGARFERVRLLDEGERKELQQELTVDSGWLRLWLEQGALGTALLLLVFVGGVARPLAAGRRRTLAAVAGGSVVLLIGIRALTLDLFDINPWNFFLPLALGLAWSRADDR